jgi:S-formylglutathione hydrolase FrmB
LEESIMVITRKRIVTAILFLVLNTLCVFAADTGKSQLVAREIESKNFSQNKIGVTPVRKLLVYLPAGYNVETKRYPVIYFFPSPLDSSFRAIFDRMAAQDILDRGISRGVIGKFIFVAVDMTTPLGSSWYVNSPVTGNWEDFVIQELVPYVDANFRTLASRDSRGIAGHFMDGYGAIHVAMKNPQIFGSLYALHPVGTGNGVKILASLPNWELMEKAKTLDDVKKDGYHHFHFHLPGACSQC